jgi:eukaryotic-like serine/threonine-protein kinase
MRGNFRQPIWIIPLAIAGLVALIGWYGHTRLRQTIEAELRTSLASTLDANVTALTIWMTNQTRLAAYMAEEPEIRRLSLSILNQPPPRPGLFPGRSLIGFAETEEFSNYLRGRLTRVSYDAAELVTTNFMVAAQTGPGRMRMPGMPLSEAHTNQYAELFATGEPFVITPYKPEVAPGPPPPMEGQRGRGGFGQPGFGGGMPARGQGRRFGTNAPPGGRRGGFMDPGQGRRGDLTLMQVAAPVRGDDGTVRGALALIINPDREFTRMLSVTRSGESGETYAFDQHGLLLSKSRFDDQLRKLGLLDATNTSSALNLRLYDPGVDLTKGMKPAVEEPSTRELTRIVAAAVSGEDGVDVVADRDYRGVPVVGAWRWLPEYGFGVASQIDAAEAYRPLRLLQGIFVLLFLVLVFCACIMFLFSYRDVAWRRRLGEAELKLKQLGQYTLEQKIGEGGMGIVYRARHALMRRDTAIKLLLPERADSASVERFEREVCLTCQLSHPNTIQIFDYGHTPEGVFYYVMELLQGLNLRELVTRYGPVSEGRVIHILTQVCDSLSEAHARGLIHRDIKPENVFLCERGGVPDCVKVLDFGLVRLYRNGRGDNRHLTQEKDIVGTPCFMAPESIKNAALTDPRSDVYAVGALAYFLFTGEHAFDAETVMEIYEKQLTQTPVPPGQRRPGSIISSGMERTILSCLERDVSLRPQTVGELRALLLASPHANEWGLEARAAWWSSHPIEAPTASAQASPMPGAVTVVLAPEGRTG